MRRKRNRISCLKNNQGNWVYEETDVADLIKKGFINLFCTNVDSVLMKNQDIPSWPRHVDEESLVRLTAKISMQEVKEGLSSLKLLKAPGPDGYHVGFFQAYWHVVGMSIFEEVSKIFLATILPAHFNDTLITLIPKCLEVWLHSE